MNALRALRDCITRNNGRSPDQLPIELSKDGCSLTIDDQHFDRKAQTPWTDADRTVHYKIDALYIAWKTDTEPYSQYVFQCIRNNVEKLDVRERKELTQYLRSEKDSSRFLDHTFNVRGATTVGVTTDERPAKKPKLEETKKENGVQPSQSSTQRRRPKPKQARFMKERLLDTRQSMLIAPIGFQGFDSGMVAKFEKFKRNGFKRNEPAGLSNGGSSAPDPGISIPIIPTKRVILRTEKPIIIVPAAVTSLIGTNNALHFLQKQQFVPPNRNKRRRNDSVDIAIPSETERGGKVTYQVVSSNHILPEQDWKRVVAVFCDGKKWQFTDWPSNWDRPAKIFTKALGFHLHYDNEPPHSNTKQWRVTPVRISKTKRHEDRKVVHGIMTKLKHFISNHPNKRLLYK